MRGIFNFRFVKQMEQLGEQVFVVFFRMWIPGRKLINEYNYEGIKVTEAFIPLFPLSNYLFVKLNNFICQRLAWELFKKQLKNTDIIHSVYLTNNGVNAGYWAKKLKITHVSQAIGSDVNSDLKRFGKNKKLTFFKNIDGIITNSKDLEKTLKTLIKDCPSTDTIYRGTAIHDFEKKINTQKEGVTFLFLGGIELNKGLPSGINTKGGITLMESWKRVEDMMYVKKATLIFGGPNCENKIFQKWKSNLKYPQLVQLIGKVHPNEVEKFIKESDISIVPSMEEGLPNFLMESAANKSAAIGSNAGGIPELIVDGETGFIFQKGNVEQLAELLLNAASNKKSIVKMGEAAFDRVKIHFNAKDYSNNIISFYKSILEKCAE
jgi:glycosyltransferase involved in cell wall biosynthesis